MENKNLGFFTGIDPVRTGKRIKELRMLKGISVEDLQNFMGFTAPQAIYKWQSGKSLPSLDNFFALARLLGEPMEQILVPIDLAA